MDEKIKDRLLLVIDGLCCLAEDGSGKHSTTEDIGALEDEDIRYSFEELLQNILDIREDMQEYEARLAEYEGEEI